MIFRFIYFLFLFFDFYLKAQTALRPLPVLAVDDLEVHVDSGDEHLTVDANLVDGRRREGVSHHHHPHDLIGHRAAVRQRHPDAKTSRDVDHLSGEEKTEEERVYINIIYYYYYQIRIQKSQRSRDTEAEVSSDPNKVIDRNLLWILPLIFFCSSPELTLRMK